MDKSPDWDTSWSTIDLARQDPLKPGLFSNFLDIVIPAVAPGSKRAIEVGCFPGKFIEYVGQKGYRISGIDTYPRVGEIARWATERGRAVESFAAETLEDFARPQPQNYDVVLSLGFIEHFVDYCQVLYDHAALCAPGGTVIVGAPNFASPIQRALHQALDETNLAAHVLEAMYPKIWAVYLSFLGFKIEHAGTVGGFDFWHETPQENPKISILQGLLPHLSPFVQKIGGEFNTQEASYLAVVGTRIKALPSRDDAAQMSSLCREVALDLSHKDASLGRGCAQFLDELCR